MTITDILFINITSLLLYIFTLSVKNISLALGVYLKTITFSITKTNAFFYKNKTFLIYI
ncbi:hypothetical protein SAR03_16000 [Staphylococcus arlettae]|uniref:Uncharacterized protein n=1 Tax=Staphylococcus arlettae TaxID=29378 RepID=A0ABQ0XXT0_9STAP|nr:hypothetical protein SAR03_16000 [Staphylococcus arlettae]